MPGESDSLQEVPPPGLPPEEQLAMGSYTSAYEFPPKNEEIPANDV